MVVGRFVGFAIEPKRGWFIHNHASRGEHLLRPILKGRIHGRSVNERFEHRAWLALRQHVVQLAVGIVSATHQRFHFACLRINRHQCHLCRTMILYVAALQILVYFNKAYPHRFRGIPLQIHIESGVNAIYRTGEIMIAKMFL